MYTKLAIARARLILGYDKALGAIRSAKAPLVTQIYLSSHTLEQAAAHGIGIPMAGR